MRLVVVLVAAILAGAACSSGEPQLESPSAGLPSPSLTGPSSTAAPSTSSDLVVLADAACRASPFGDDLGTLALSSIILGGDLVTIVYTGPEGDALCQHSPPYFGDIPIVQTGSHLADLLSADAPIIRDQGATWSSQTGGYVWGAVGPEVASVVIEIPSSDQRIPAEIADGYFLAVIDPTVQCCVAIAVALDPNGQELARAE